MLAESSSHMTRKVLVDNGNSADIMYMTAYQQLRLDSKRLQSFKSPLVSFSGDRIYPKGIILLSATIRMHTAQITKKVDFFIVGCPSSYNDPWMTGTKFSQGYNLNLLPQSKVPNPT